jgi:hypothetical protein
MYLRKKGKYYQIVEHYKENGKTKQRVLLHIGTVEKIYEVFKAHKEMLGIVKSENSKNT